MSKRRHRDRNNTNNNSWNTNASRNNMRGPMNNYPFGISPEQLLSMFGGNLDMNRINNILSSMSRDGFNFNGINDQMKNYTYNKGNMNNNPSNNANFDNQMNNKEFSKEQVEKYKKRGTNIDEMLEKAKQKKIDEENIVFLINLKEIVDDKRQIFIDNIIDVLLK